METRDSKPLIVERDRTVYLEVQHPRFKEMRDSLMRFAELEKSPRYVHVYKITSLSLWNAAAAGLTAKEIKTFLTSGSKYPVPACVLKEVEDVVERYGWVKLVNIDGEIHLTTTRADAYEEITSSRTLSDYLEDTGNGSTPEIEGSGGVFSIPIRPECRGQLKVAMIKLGLPIEDVAGYQSGAPLPVPLADSLDNGCTFRLRPYQREAVAAFYDEGRVTGGSGVISLPCGSGKTIVALGVLNRVGAQALILSTNTTALRQWKRELLEKTKLDESLIGEYSGDRKEIRPITLSTYQMLTYRDRRTKELLHYKLFTARDWGIIVYDEVHLLPAPVFRFTAQIQATRRLGLTATLVREDGREAEVFSLIGPKKYDIPWKSLESEGWIADASCVEVRLDLDEASRKSFAALDRRGKFRIASENAEKIGVIRELLSRHPRDRVLILGQYLDQLDEIRREIGAPMITGKTPNSERETLYARFRRGEIPVLIVSKVGNFAVDLPDATVAIQVSGTFGSRQEEAQRLGRILRPKADGKRAVFYTVVSRDTPEQDFAEKRQRFLAEQGYRYTIIDHNTRHWQDYFQRQDSA